MGNILKDDGQQSWKTFAISSLFALLMLGLTVYNGILVSRAEAQTTEIQKHASDIVDIKLALTELAAVYRNDKDYIKQELSDIKDKLQRIELSISEHKLKGK